MTVDLDYPALRKKYASKQHEDRAVAARDSHRPYVMTLYSATDGAVLGYMVRRATHVAGPFRTEDEALDQAVRDSYGTPKEERP